MARDAKDSVNQSYYQAKDMARDAKDTAKDTFNKASDQS